MTIREFPCPKLNTGEVLVRVACCALCGSDLHTYFGRRFTPMPTILGHESMGEIAVLGPGKPARDALGRLLRVGDRVTWSVVASCGECFFGQHDLPQKCERMFKYGHESCRNGRPLSDELAKYCNLAASTPIVRLPAAVPDEGRAKRATGSASAASVAADDAESFAQRYTAVLGNGRFPAASLAIGFQNCARYGLLIWVPVHMLGAECKTHRLRVDGSGVIDLDDLPTPAYSITPYEVADGKGQLPIRDQTLEADHPNVTEPGYLSPDIWKVGPLCINR